MSMAPAAQPAGDPQLVTILVSGANGVGKSSFVSALSEIEVVTTRRLASDPARILPTATTVRVDWGRLSIARDLAADLFALPGGRTFDLLWEILARATTSLIALVDSTRPDTFRETKAIIEFFQRLRPMPYLIAATKQDHPNAWTPDELRPALRLPEQVAVLPCVATNRESCAQVTLELIDRILAAPATAPRA